MSGVTRFCDACKDALLYITQTQGICAMQIDHHKSLETFQKAALTCPLCVETFGRKRLKEYLADTPTPGPSMVTRWSVVASLKGTEIVVKLYDVDNETVVHSADALMLEKIGPSFNYELPAQFTSHWSYTGSDRSLKFAKYCLQTCLSQHHKCGRPRLSMEEDAFQPTRLIYLHPDKTTISLATGDVIPTGVRYVTLSHCWGKPRAGESPIRLLDHNLEQWKVQIPPLDSNLKFAHAVDITRRLGFSYLWIDSLCIIQESKPDWQHEAALMSRVYKFAVFNIAAASAKDSTTGCYYGHFNENKIVYLRVSGSDVLWLNVGYVSEQKNLWSPSEPIPEVYRIFGVPRGGPPEPGNDPVSGKTDPTYMQLGKEPLYQRGWVLQERMLAPRILNCTSGGLNWECSEGFAMAENGEQFFTPKPRKRDSRPLFDAFIRPGGIGQSGHSHVSRDILLEGLRAWMSTVETYMQPDRDQDSDTYKENLTVASDKLVAISAVARELKPFMHCQYIAGLWEDQLLSQLSWLPGSGDRRNLGIWSRNSDVHFVRHVEHYRAPSWSWASYKGAIKFLNLDCMNERHLQVDGALVEIIDAKAEPVPGGDEFGQLVSGYLTLRGCLFPLESRPSDATWVGPFDETFRGDREYMYRGQRVGMQVFEDDLQTEQGPACMAWCLPIEVHASGYPVSRGDGITIIFALLLKKVDGRRFRRVGLMCGEFIGVFKADPIVRAMGTLHDVTGGGKLWEHSIFEPEALTDVTII